eukprot:TRINITY_DN123788_c0_g1_i1.p1 TRINITY_DN123788_c0_g1~~TRINITY_DN123788_c0_g1_i1.p1  ORF type:complete len:212 (-),score=72.40 TRINITY_DN123788_c0_g1_i1:119-754(-)
MSKRKGLSFDEKKAVLLGAMHAECTFYTLKELESLGKSKGVIPQAVKEVVEALSADGSVNSDKVGSQQLFWALPSERAAGLRAKVRRIREESEKTGKDLENLQREVASLAALEGGAALPSEQQAAELRSAAAADKKRCAELKGQIEAFERCGPGRIAEMLEETKMCKDAANRWADNICSVRSRFCRERRGEVTSALFNRNFELPEDFDYLE